MLAAGQRGVRYGAGRIKRHLLVDMQLSVKDESYQWFLRWMTLHHRSQLSRSGTSVATQEKGKKDKAGVIGGLLRRFTPRIHHLSVQTENVTLPNGSVHTRISLVPGPGTHLLRYKNAFLKVDRVRQTNGPMDLTSGKPWETITLTALYAHEHILEDILTQCHRLAEQDTEGKTIIYRASRASWEKFGDPRRKRPLESVVLDKGVKERIVTDVKYFLEDSERYYSRGIPYSRGYLLHGPPGSGKSSFIKALAGELDYNIAILNLSEKGLTDDRLNYLLANTPQRTLILLEDVDAAFSNRKQVESDGYSGANVTFSGLLNALDGVDSAEERILFFTTNHKERLDDAFIRPGRVDMSIRLGEATRWQAGLLWDRFYGEIDHAGEYKREFLNHLETLGIIDSEQDEKADPQTRTTTAALQGLFLFNEGNMRGAIDDTPSLIPARKSEKPLADKQQAGEDSSR